jgi:hypothetical protein
MVTSEWLAVVAISIGLIGGAIGWMMRISRGLTKLEGLLFRIEKNEGRLQRHSDRLDDHGTRLTVIETQEG